MTMRKKLGFCEISNKKNFIENWKRPGKNIKKNCHSTIKTIAFHKLIEHSHKSRNESELQTSNLH